MKFFAAALILFFINSGCTTVQENEDSRFTNYHEFDALEHQEAVSKAVLFVLSTPTDFDHVGGAVEHGVMAIGTIRAGIEKRIDLGEEWLSSDFMALFEEYDPSQHFQPCLCRPSYPVALVLYSNHEIALKAFGPIPEFEPESAHDDTDSIFGDFGKRMPSGEPDFGFEPFGFGVFGDEISPEERIRHYKCAVILFDEAHDSILVSDMRNGQRYFRFSIGHEEDARVPQLISRLMNMAGEDYQWMKFLGRK